MNMESRYLFRGKRSNIKDAHEGEWVYGDYVGGMAIIERDGNKSYSIDCERGNFECRGTWIIDPDSIGQCIGFRDKNGKMIFEGDVIRHCETNPILYVAAIEMRKFGWKCMFRCVDDGKEASGAFLDRCEIIGNIHDNPELLGGEGAKSVL